MTGNEYRLRQQLYQLNSMKQNKVQFVLWKLTKEQFDYLSRYYHIEPCLYIIKTRHLSNIRTINEPLLKDIHYANKRGKKEMVRSLSESQMKLLDSMHITYKLCKYLIYLR